MWTNLPGDILTNIIASLLLFLLGFASRDFAGRYRTRRRRTRVRMHALRSQPSFSATWLRHYYLDRGKLDDMFLAEFEEGRCYIPLLTKRKWCAGPFPELEILAVPPVMPRSLVAEDMHIVRDRENFIALDSSVGKLWNGELLCVSMVDDSQPVPELQLSTSTYFQYLSACGSLEDETISAIIGRDEGTPIRDMVACSAEIAEKCLLGAHGLGMQVTFAFPQNGEFRVLIQRRSLSVATYAGSLAVVPVCGCEAHSAEKTLEVSFQYEFLREYLEELYSVDELERPSKRVDDRWFYSNPAAQELLSRMKVGNFVFEILGFGFDALNGEVNVAALAIVLDESFSSTELRAMTTNWEVKEIEVVPLFSQQLRESILADELQPGSAFSLCLAMNRVSSFYLNRLDEKRVTNA